MQHRHSCALQKKKINKRLERYREKDTILLSKFFDIELFSGKRY